MNARIFSFCLFLLWLGVVLTVFVVGPIVYPKMFRDSSQIRFLGFGAGLLAMWNGIKWWSLRQRARSRIYEKELTAAYQMRSGRHEVEPEKPVINPDFLFEDKPVRLPPPPPPNGTAH